MKIKPYPIEFNDEAYGTDNLATLKGMVSERKGPISLKYTCNYSAIAEDLLTFLATDAAASVVSLEIVFKEEMDDKAYDKETIDRLVCMINLLSPSIKSLSIELPWKYKKAQYIESIKDILEKNTTLTNLSLTRFTLSEKNVKKLFEHLASNAESNICAIELDSCHYTDGALEQFCRLLKLHGRITEFKVNSLFFSEYRDADKIFAELLSNNVSLKHFAARDAVTTDAQFEQLASALASNHTLQTLDLSNRINVREVLDRSIILLAGVLHTNTSLLHLNLSRLAADFDHSPISSDGMAALASMLRVNTTLQSLDLFLNHLPAHSMQLLMNAVRSNKGLRKLSIGQNAVSDHEVVEVIRHNGSLQKIQGSAMDNLKAVIEALEGNTSLVSLTLPESESCNQTKRKQLEEIWKLLSRNREAGIENTPRLAAVSMFRPEKVSELPEEKINAVSLANR